MNKGRMFSWTIMLLLSFVLFLPSLTVHANDRVYHILLEDEVEKGLHAYLKRAFDEAVEAKAKTVILEIHTPGGFTDAAEDIAKLMDSTPLNIIAFVNSKAHSAGAYLSLHADKIYMVPNGTIGAAAIIDSAGNAASKKANSAWIAEMRAAAESSGKDPLYAQAMADESINLPKFRAPIGKLLTLSAEEALEVGYSDGTVANLNELLAELGLSKSEVVSIEPTFAEKLARFITNPIVVTLLLTIASFGLVIELFSPGFGIPGIVGLTSFAAFFFGHFIAGFAGYESILIFAIGFILLIAELFVPGGIVGIIGGALMIISLLFAGESVVHMAYSILIALIISVIGMVVLMKFFGKNLHVFNKLILRDATTTEEGYVSNVNRIELLGKIGDTITPLRPAGTVLIGNERIDVVSEGSYIDVNKKIEVIRVEGSRIVVRELKKGVEEV
ncbi:NfeD family protein [Lysinibacillus endophyticus]|uniref:Nodulation protein NfeD n=1 Tax=Ureibacillus endophyticus TaxID=1978490 RepID=A0A494Z953_9BACL|nr:nodulation protein NfeD [Lysinibacillus endophyticus]MCP1145334.1 nodulation protein NfeD [Lysinibacillus endophyticus]RKQ19164.1 nodulation protein NfeD [Lysinibacillus endophyticus]